MLITISQIPKCFFCPTSNPKHKDSSFTTKKHEKKQQIRTFKELELELEKYSNDYQNIWNLILFQSANQLIEISRKLNKLLQLWTIPGAWSLKQGSIEFEQGLNERQNTSAESEIQSESIKPKGYPTPGCTYGPAVLPLTLLGDSRGQPCIHPSPSVSLRPAPAYLSQLLYCPLMATWLWVTFPATLHLINQTHLRHIEITVTGCQCQYRRTQTSEWTPTYSFCLW